MYCCITNTINDDIRIQRNSIRKNVTRKVNRHVLVINPHYMKIKYNDQTIKVIGLSSFEKRLFLEEKSDIIYLHFEKDITIIRFSII